MSIHHQKLLKKKIDQKIDLFDRGNRLIKIDLNHNFPRYLLNNIKKYKEWII